MKKTVILLTLALFLVGTGLAAGENLAPETATQVSDTDKISFTDYSNVTIFDQLTSGLLSVTSTDSVYRPGETISFDVTAEFITEESGSFDKVVGIYKCYDSGCDDPNLDTRVDVFSESEFFYAQVGDKVSWTVDWQAPSEEGYYAATGYVNDPGNMVLTETPNRKIFEVREENLEPDVVQDGSVDFYIANGMVHAEVPIANEGGADMIDRDILEMQVRPEGEGILSFTSGQDTCDSDYPENVHKEFQLSAGDSGTITLSSSLDHLDKDVSYEVFILSTEDCYPDNSPVPPFYDTGEKVGEFDYRADVEKTSPPVENVYTTEEFVSMEIGLRNTGVMDMSESDILEMQVRPQGLQSLSLVSGQSVCDSDYPENVHKEFRLDAGDGGTITLSSPLKYLEPGESYDVYAVTVEGCAPNNDPVPPYYDTGEKVGSFTVASDGSGGDSDDSTDSGGETGGGETGGGERGLVEYAVFGLGVILAGIWGVRKWLV